jgi:uncharacterized membrane-anchored protein
VGIGMLGFALTLWLPFRTRRYNAFTYWAAVMIITVSEAARKMLAAAAD